VAKKKKGLRWLASEVAFREGKKSQARIGDIREILSVVGQILLEQGFVGAYELMIKVLESGARRKKV
jgi:hypothetical protein